MTTNNKPFVDDIVVTFPRDVENIANTVEFMRIMREYRDELYQVERRAATQLLVFFREVLSSYVLRRHTVTVHAAGKQCCLMVNGMPLRERYDNRHLHTAPVLRALWYVECRLSASMAHYIRNERLN